MTKFREEIEARYPHLSFLADEIERHHRALYRFRIQLYADLGPDFLHLVYEGPSGRYGQRLGLREIAHLLGARNDIAELFGLSSVSPKGVTQTLQQLNYITQEAAAALISSSLKCPSTST